MDKNAENKKKKKSGGGKLIWSFLEGSRGFFLLAIICSALSSLADMVTPKIICLAVDNVIGNEPADQLSFTAKSFLEFCGGRERLRGALWILAAAVLLVALLKVIAQYGLRVMNTKGSETMVKTMRDRLFVHIEHLPFQWHMENHTGDIIQRCTSDIETMRAFVTDQLTGLIRIGLLLVFSMVFMFGMNVPLTLIGLIPVPFIIWYSVSFHNKVRDEFIKCDESEGKLSAMAQENLTGVRVVRAFGRENYERERFIRFNEGYTNLWRRMAEVMSRFWATGDVLSATQILLVIVFGVIFCLKGRMTGGEYIAFISYNSLLIWPIRQLGRLISEMSKAGVAIDRVKYIMDSETEKDREGAADADMGGDIVFDHVSFGYDNCPEILHDVSLTVKAGTTLGILGGTGSGKSTLMYLLDRLYPLSENGGSIRINGVDIRDIRLEHLRKNIGIVLQEPFLFSRTLQENLKITNEDLSLEEVKEAARTACLDETIDGFTKGYDTFVGERGVTLSGGQKQRAAIARMLTKNTPIMIFDDSLSAVDTETDAKIRASLEKHFGQATIILISHRITTLNKADKVLVLEQGRVAQFGSPEELREQSGLYRKIYEIQTSSREEAGD